MMRQWLLPLVGVTAAVFTAYHVVTTNVTPPMQDPPVAPAKSPFGQTVAGAGIVEAQTENISIGAHVPGIVVERSVEVGQRVKAGALLFRLDDRAAQADLKIRESRLAAAQAQLKRLEALPRPEEVPASEARVRRLRASVTAAKDALDRAERLYPNQAIGEEELIRKRESAAAAQEELNQAVADDGLLKDGAWEADLSVAQSQVQEAQSMVDQAKVELSRLEIRSPIDGQVLQVNVRVGEYVGTPPGQALIVLGDLKKLRVRVDVDESDIPDFRPGMAGKAFLRGGSSEPIHLRFVRVEPFVIPKRSLTRAAQEQVDTRVLQVIYEIESSTNPVYVGQQLDVFFDESKRPEIASPVASSAPNS